MFCGTNDTGKRKASILKNVGIITFINTVNFGASLQAYALQETVRSFGLNAEVIQYTNKSIEAKEKNTGKKSLYPKNIMRSLVMGRGLKNKAKAFENFEKDFMIPGKLLTDQTADEVNTYYDKFITGSDQVWNKQITHGDWHYYLDFVKETSKIMSYAPSFGNSEFPMECYQQAGELLSRFHALSVREQSGAELIHKLCSRHAQVVLDPTLLMDKAKWEKKIIFKPDFEHYILVYFPHDKKLVFNFVEKLKKKTGLPVIYLSISPRIQPGTHTIYDSSPDEFLGWVQHADFVVTGSFHGTAFSLNLEKQFYYEPSGEGSRIDNIVKLCGAENRSILTDDLDSRLDFTGVREKLNMQRIISLNWLKIALFSEERIEPVNQTVAVKKSVIVPVAKRECCGCGACVSVCPNSAISMCTDEEGFSYPAVDNKSCIECGLCTKHCAFANRMKQPLPKELPKCYIAKHRDTSVRMHSRSGGVFVACSDWVLQQGGVVYGCVLNDNMEAVHVCAESAEEQKFMCKSKYVQSNTNGIFSQVKIDLDAGRTVLFSGTGCQVDSLLGYLNHMRTDLTGLYTMDIICHGCASPLLFKDFIAWLEKKYQGKVTSFEFRDKTICGWDGHIESAIINGKKLTGITFREIFHTDLCIRPSCYNCKYASVARPADITIGDAWGIKKVLSEFNDNRGVSLFLVRGEKGALLKQAIEASCEEVELPLNGPLLQGNLHSPSKPKGNREAFWWIYQTGGIELLIEKYAKKSMTYKAKKRTKYLLRKVLMGRKYYLP